MKYTISIDQPQQQYIQITAFFHSATDTMEFHLPSWRPGRYELGNFAKNVKDLRVFDVDSKKRLEINKISKDCWQAATEGSKEIRVEYRYYAADLNAGSSFLSEEQLYVNPVNCFVFSKEQFSESVQLELNIPSFWEIATSMRKNGTTLLADNFDELADSPFICSAQLQHDEYTVANTLFHLWFNGESKPDWERLKKDFEAFTQAQIDKFGEFPVAEYHFLFQILPYKAYHGVEHCKSTVIALGPSYAVFGDEYKELLGVSSHELYHTWNVKAIRPIDMQPYDFTKENYSQLGYICEGITTYMGDLFLLKSGVFSLKQYLKEFNNQLQKHFDNFGRFNYSVAESSFDTWLDGYVSGAPGRKVSIYTEGCLLAFVTDVRILRATKNHYGLDEVMKRLYYDFALKGKGVSESDYKEVLENISGISFDDLFTDYIHGTRPYESILVDCLEYLGLSMEHVPSASYSAGKLGFKALKKTSKVTAIYPGSPAYLGGLMIDDEVISVNGIKVTSDLDNWLGYFADEEKNLVVHRIGKHIALRLPEVQRNFYCDYTVTAMDQAIASQKKAFEAWKK
jgi:predicted metalloprotease with PDZ domain